MKLNNKNVIYILLLLTSFLVACSSKGEKRAINNEIEDTLNEVEDNVNEVEDLPLVIRSVQDLQLAIENSKMNKAQSFQVDPTIELSSIEYFYVPTIEFDRHQLFQIEVLENYIIYYYIPNDNLKSTQAVFDYSTGIEVAFSRKPDKDDPMAPLVKQAGIELTEDNILYEKDKNSVTFAVGDTWMSIRVPDELNDYEYLKNLGSAEKINVEKTK